ncbi:MAG TPA: PHB depolymerase family esterase [Planctomycetaceae bacterium]|nr:PHB depolymerase family esterase [Planctomycetaceae bacterium]
MSLLSLAMATHLLAALAAEPLGPGDHSCRLESEGRTRTFLVHVPPDYDPGRPTPVVLIFHGTAMNARMMATLTGMSKKADEAGFIAVYPNGTGPTKLIWTFNCGGLAELESMSRPDDVAFTARLLDELASLVHVDSQRVFATGLSNGGMMCYRLAAELSDRIAAIAPVAGTIGIENYQPKRPVPVIHFHGTSDAIITWDGPSETTETIISFKPVDETMRLCAEANRCRPTPVTTDLPDVVDDGTSVTRQEYRPSQAGADVVLYKIHGGGHSWPGQASLERILGRATMDIAANDLIWDFFQKHPLHENVEGRSIATRPAASRFALPPRVTRQILHGYRSHSRASF